MHEHLPLPRLYVEADPPAGGRVPWRQVAFCRPRGFTTTTMHAAKDPKNKRGARVVFGVAGRQMAGALRAEALLAAPG